MEVAENDSDGSQKTVHRYQFPEDGMSGSCDGEHPAQSHPGTPSEDGGECKDCPSTSICFALLPSDLLRRGPLPFALSDPTEYAHLFQGFKENCRSNSEGIIVDTLSGFTFVLRVTRPDASGEVAVELIAVFEGDVPPLSDS